MILCGFEHIPDRTARKEERGSVCDWEGRGRYHSAHHGCLRGGERGMLTWGGTFKGGSSLEIWSQIQPTVSPTSIPDDSHSSQVGSEEPPSQAASREVFIPSLWLPGMKN